MCCLDFRRASHIQDMYIPRPCRKSDPSFSFFLYEIIKPQRSISVLMSAFFLCLAPLHPLFSITPFLPFISTRPPFSTSPSLSTFFNLSPIRRSLLCPYSPPPPLSLSLSLSLFLSLCFSNSLSIFSYSLPFLSLSALSSLPFLSLYLCFFPLSPLSPSLFCLYSLSLSPFLSHSLLCLSLSHLPPLSIFTFCYSSSAPLAATTVNNLNWNTGHHQGLY